MFSPVETTNGLLLELVGMLLVIAVLLTTARQPRRTVVALSGVAVALVALTIAGVTLILSFHVQQLPQNRLLAGVLEFTLMADAISPLLILAAWVASLWRAAKAGQWSWFVGLLPFVLLSMVGPLLIGHPELIVGQAAANQLTTSSLYTGWVFLFATLTAQLLTPLAALVYGLASSDDRPHAQPQAAS